MEVLLILQRLVEHGIPAAPFSQNTDSGRNLPIWARLLISLTIKFIDLREDLRFLLDHCLFQLRRTLLCLGEKSGLGELVFFLTLPELKAMGKKQAGNAGICPFSQHAPG